MDDLTGRDAGWNPPGRTELVFRPGTYATFLEQMLDAVPLQPALGDDPPRRAGASLSGPWRDGGERWDVIPALLDAWAAVGDVLGFYQERILNEGYLRTAVQPFSHMALSATLGFSLEHGLSAGTWLAFSVQPAAGGAPSVTLPAGTAAESVPGPGEDPQPFETAAPLLARPEWNAMPLRPPVVEVSQPLGPEPTEARVEGVSTGLVPGAPVLLDAGTAWVFGAVASVQPDPAAGYTLVAWTPAPGGSQGQGFAGARLYTFAVQAPLFGHDAADWATLPDGEKRVYSTLLGGVYRLAGPQAAWTQENDGLPVSEVRALAVDGGGTAFAGTAGAGIVRLPAGADRWGPCGAIPLSDVYALAPGFRGQLLAGLSGGRVFRSGDGGDSWDPVSGVTLQKAEVGGATVYVPLPALLPDTPVRALATWSGPALPDPGDPAPPVEADEQDYYLAGTDAGVFFATDAGGAWTGVNEGLPGYDASTRTAAASVASLACSPDEPPVIYAGTDGGVYRWERDGDTPGPWTPTGPGLVHPVTGAALTARTLGFGHVWGTHGLLAGTDAGVYRLGTAADGTALWVPMSDGLPTDAAGVPPAVRAIVIPPPDEGAAYAGTAAGTWRWDLLTARWIPATDLAPAGPPLDVQALALLSGGALLAATPFAGFDPDGWPSPPIVDDVAYLDGVFPEIAPGTRIVFQQREGASQQAGGAAPGQKDEPKHPAGCRAGDSPRDDEEAGPPALVATRSVESAEIVRYAAYGMERTATRVTVSAPWLPPGQEDPAPLDQFDMRGTVVYAAAAELPLAQRRVPAGTPAGQEEPSAAAPAAGPTLRPLASAELRSTREPDGTRASRLHVRRSTLHLHGAAAPAPGRPAIGAAGAGAAPDPRPLRLESLTGRRVEVAGPIPAMDPQRPVAVTGRRSRAALVPASSVFAWAEGGWRTRGLASMDVEAVAAAGTTLLAAVSGPAPRPAAPGASPLPGLYRADDGGEWARVDALGDAAVLCLLAGLGGAVWAGTDGDGVWRGTAAGGWEPVGPELRGIAVACLALDPDGAPLAGTRDAGVWRLEDGGWVPLGSGLPRGVRALAAPTGTGVLAGTPDGTWRLEPGESLWRWEAEGMANADVQALAALPGGRTAAGTAGGVYLQAAPGAPWKAASLNLHGAALDVRALLLAGDGALWAGTRGGGAWRSDDGGASWLAAPTGAANDVRALAPGDGTVLAGCGGRPLLDTDRGTAAAFDLEALFALPAAFAADLDRGDLPGPLRDRFGQVAVPLDPAAYVVVQEKTRAWWIQQPDGLLALRREAGPIRVRRPRALGTLLAAPAEPVADAPAPSETPAALRLGDALGRQGTLAARPDELAWRPAADDDAGAAEVCLVLATEEGTDGGTVLVLEAPLGYAYDPATVAVLGNVARATHGGSRAEVLGSGNGAQPGQRFRLAEGPLTWVAPPAPGMSGSTLRVRADGVEWQPVESLYGQPGDAPAYVVEVDAEGAAALHFGDGTKGARLPSGRENVTARYRVGVGPAGNVPAASITQLGAAPVGVEGVTNPVAATGGLPGETPAQARDRAPLRARTLQRVVSLSDYGDFALVFPGVAKAAAGRVSARAGAVITVTVAAAGDPADGGEAVVRLLTDAIGGARGDDTPFRVLPAARVPFRLACEVAVDPRRDPAEVVAAVAAALAAVLAADRRRLAEPLAASVALAAAQAVPGVAGAWLTAFHLSSDTPSVQAVLPADAARWDGHADRLLPAQLLVPDPDGGISVRQAEDGAGAPAPAGAAPAPVAAPSAQSIRASLARARSRLR